MKPEDVNHYTELDSDYSKELAAVTSPDEFESFLKKYDYWLDEGSKKLTGSDWERLKPLIADCRVEGREPTKKHDEAIALMMPEKIFKVSMVSTTFGAPWGCAYIRLKELKKINY